jgi:hypothetical protein
VDAAQAETQLAFIGVFMPREEVRAACFVDGRNRSCTSQLLALQALKTSWWVVKRTGFV